MASSTPSTRQDVASMFGTFRSELDDHNDRRERLIKSSRDITNLSKKVIFLLHRIMTEDLDSGEKSDHSRAADAALQGRSKLHEIQRMFASITNEIQGDRFWRYSRNVSPGLQEYIEALSFVHYLQTNTLVTYDEVQHSLSDETGKPYFPLPLEDYLLGLSDLTGELMRYAISSISRRGHRTKAYDICTFVRGCRSDFEALSPYFKELRKKQAVTSQSLQKIEDAAYAIAVRSSEYDLPPEMLDSLVSDALSSSQRNMGPSRLKRPRDDDSDEDG